MKKSLIEQAIESFFWKTVIPDGWNGDTVEKHRSKNLYRYKDEDGNTRNIKICKFNHEDGTIEADKGITDIKKGPNGRYIAISEFKYNGKNSQRCIVFNAKFMPVAICHEPSVFEETDYADDPAIILKSSPNCKIPWTTRVDSNVEDAFGIGLKPLNIIEIDNGGKFVRTTKFHNIREFVFATKNCCKCCYTNEQIQNIHAQSLNLLKIKNDKLPDTLSKISQNDFELVSNVLQTNGMGEPPVKNKIYLIEEIFEKICIDRVRDILNNDYKMRQNANLNNEIPEKDIEVIDDEKIPQLV